MNALTGKEGLFSSDTYLLPAIENDGLLRTSSPVSLSISSLLQLNIIELSFDDEDEDEEEPEAAENPSKEVDKDKIILHLRRKLEQAKRDFSDYRDFVQSSFLSAQDREEISKEEGPSTSKLGSGSKGMARLGARGDDDSHYFDSYGLNGEKYFV